MGNFGLALEALLPDVRSVFRDLAEKRTAKVLHLVVQARFDHRVFIKQPRCRCHSVQLPGKGQPGIHIGTAHR